MLTIAEEAATIGARSADEVSGGLRHVDEVSEGLRHVDDARAVFKAADDDAWRAMKEAVGEEMRDQLLEAAVEQGLREIFAPDLAGSWGLHVFVEDALLGDRVEVYGSERSYLGGGLYTYTRDGFFPERGVELYGENKRCKITTWNEATVKLLGMENNVSTQCEELVLRTSDTIIVRGEGGEPYTEKRSDHGG